MFIILGFLPERTSFSLACKYFYELAQTHVRGLYLSSKYRMPSLYFPRKCVDLGPVRPELAGLHRAELAIRGLYAQKWALIGAIKRLINSGYALTVIPEIPGTLTIMQNRVAKHMKETIHRYLGRSMKTRICLSERELRRPSIQREIACWLLRSRVVFTNDYEEGSTPIDYALLAFMPNLKTLIDDSDECGYVDSRVFVEAPKYCPKMECVTVHLAVDKYIYYCKFWNLEHLKEVHVVIRVITSSKKMRQIRNRLAKKGKFGPKIGKLIIRTHRCPYHLPSAYDRFGCMFDKIEIDP